MPEFVKTEAPSGFPHQCFTCITHACDDGFYYVGEAAGYGLVSICARCVQLLARYEGCTDPGEGQKLRDAIEERDRLIDELNELLEQERTRQYRVVSVDDILGRRAELVHAVVEEPAEAPEPKRRGRLRA